MPKKNTDSISFKKHIGIYAYRVSLLKRFSTWKETTLEKMESLEQLRCLEHNVFPIIDEAQNEIFSGIDTSEDLKKAKKLLFEMEKV